MVHLYIKVFLIFTIAFAALHTLRFIYSTKYYFSDQGSLVAFRTGTWTCEMDKRLIIQLRNELREKEKLLKYRERVINKLRKTIINLNRTVVTNTTTVADTRTDMKATLGSTKDSSRPLRDKESLDRDIRRSADLPTPFPDDLDKVASTNKRPCCVGLKRMTDILRKYMDVANQLKEQVAIYEARNLTAELIKYGEKVKKRTIAKNCSTHFIPAIVEKEKDGLFLSSDMKSVYEATPLYLRPKQKLANFGAKHRNLALKEAFSWAFKEFEKKTKQTIDLKIAPDVIFKTDSLKGNQYRFDVKTLTGKSYSIHVLRPLGPHVLDGPILEQSARQKELINIIVPISQRPSRLTDFLAMLQAKCNDEKMSLYLTFVIYGKATDTRKMKEIINKFSRETGFTNIDVLQRDLPFTRGWALHDGVQRWNGHENVLLFFCDIDVHFDKDFLRRCRMNTRPASMVYYPILFSQYNPEISSIPASDMRIDTESGTWRPLGFGMTCMYRLDYLKVGGFNLTIQGWGGEDNDLYSRLVRSPIKIIRAPDPNLYHKWHMKHCAKSLDRIKYNHCLGAKARYEGSQRQLGLLLFKQNTTDV